MSNTEDVKKWLRRYGEQIRHAEYLTMQVEEIESVSTAPGRPKIDGMPRDPNFTGDRIPDLIDRLERKRQRAAEAAQRAEQYRCEIEDAIEQISCKNWSEVQTILIWRYIYLKEFSDIAELLYGDDPDYWDKSDSFLRKLFNRHKAGLIELAKIIPVEQFKITN